MGVIGTTIKGSTFFNMKKDKVLALRYLSKSRLPDVHRWNRVEVVTTRDKKAIQKNQYLRDYAVDDNSVYVCWYDSKTEKNTHPFEIKEISSEELLDIAIERAAIRLKNKSKPYK